MTELIQDPRIRLIAERIWSAFPVTEPSFAKLLGLLDIEVTEAVPTAAVTLGLNSRLLINPDFAERHCRSDAALVMLVLHELWHVVLGHTRLYDRLTPAQNWAFDAIINAQLCRLYPDAAHTRLFRELYAPDQMPYALLRPPEGWNTESEVWLPGRAGEVHRQLYSDASVSTEELFRLLPTFGSGEGEGLGGLLERLLGSHTDDTQIGVAPEVMREIRGIIAEWPMVEQRSGRDLGGTLDEQKITLGQRREDAVRILRQALMRLAGLADGAGQLHPDIGPVESILPYGRDRKSWLREAWGDAVPMHRTDLPGRTLTRRGQVQVYLDVSGSMDGVIRPLYAALASLTPWLAPQVQLFSTRVEGIPIAGLRQGKVLTTGGTHIDCVTGHILEQKVERALIVTDGWVGRVSGEHIQVLKQRRVRIEAAVTDDGDPDFMKTLRGRACRLPKLI
jgi:hypothetical protein